MTWFKESKQFPPANGGNTGDNYSLPSGDIPPWEPGYEYDAGREVYAPDGSYYRCVTDHNSTGNFATDLGNGLWSVFAGPGVNTDEQQLSLDGDGVTLRLGNGTGPDTTVDLTPFLDNTDDQQLTATILPNGDIQLDLTATGTASQVVIPQGERRHNNSLFVDTQYGNNGTAQRERWDLPFQSYAAAAAAAVAGDRIVLRPGNYPSLTMVNNVDIHAETGAVAQQLSDGGVPVTCKVSGQLDLNQGGNNAVSITGNGSDISINCKDINAIGSGIFLNPGAAGTCDVTIECRRLTGTLINYNVALRGGANLDLRIQETFATAPNVAGVWMINSGGTYTGRTTIQAKTVEIGNSGNNISGVLVSNANDPTSTGYLKVIADRVVSSYTGGNNLLLPVVHMHNNMTTEIVCPDIYSPIKPVFGGSFNYPNAKLVFEGRAECGANEVVNWGNTGRLVFKRGTVLHRNSDGADLNKVVVIGNPPGAGGFFAKQTNNLRVEFNDTAVVKTSAAGTATDYLVGVDGPDSETIFKNCELIGIDVEPTTPACDASAPAEGNIYFKNTHSNKDNTVNITDTAAVSGFVGNDTALNTFDL